MDAYLVARGIDRNEAQAPKPPRYRCQPVGRISDPNRSCSLTANTRGTAIEISEAPFSICDRAVAKAACADPWLLYAITGKQPAARWHATRTTRSRS